MKKTLIIIILFFISHESSFSQEYSLWLSGEGSQSIIISTSQSTYRNTRGIYFKSLTPPFTIDDEAIRDTGIHDIQTNASFPIDARYQLRYNPNFNSIFETISGSFNLNKFQTVFVGCEPEELMLQFGPNNIRHYTTYNSPVHIFQWAVILPKYVQPSSENRERIITDQLFLSPENTFSESPVNVPYVKWQYQVNNNTFFWRDFPASIRNQFPMNAAVEEILENEVTPLGEINILRVRIVLSPPRSAQENLFGGYTYTTMPSVFSDIFIFDILNSSPQLLSFLPINTSCSYTDDGAFSMILNRDLESGEKLVASLFYEFDPITEPNVFSLVDQKDTTTLIDNGDNTFTYQWPSDTPILSGNYKVRYQTQDSSTPNPVWNSLEGTERGFLIGSPTPVTFSGTTLNNVFCNGGSDGAIRLNASGGVGNYEYQVNGSDWLPFDNTNTHLINTFSSGTYSIKVRDANECTERN